MWKSLVQCKADPAFYIKVEVNDKKPKNTGAPKNRHSYRVSVTNYVKLWSGEFDSDGIKKIMLDSNNDIEATDGQGFLKAALRMLNNPKIIDKIQFTESNAGHLDVKMLRLGAIVIKMNFTLSVCCAEQFFDSVTRPLLLIIDDQKKSETELRRLMEGISGFLSKIPNELLMRFEKQKIEQYNDEMHMQKHNVMEELFGRDLEERIDPRHILYGRPLPALPYNMPLPIKEEADSTGAEPSSTDTMISIGPIKTEPIDANQGTSVSNKGTSVSNDGTSVSNDGTSVSNKDTSVSNDCTSVSNVGTSVSKIGTSVSNNSHPDTVGTNNTVANLKQETLIRDEPYSTEHANNVNVQLSRTRRRSTEAQSSQISRNITPKKHRKNLNY